MALGISSVGLTGGLAGASASLTYKNLVSKYQGFSQPEAWVEFNGKPFNDSSIIVTDINVEATCGFEASVARLRLYNVFDKQTGKFTYDSIKQSVNARRFLRAGTWLFGKAGDCFCRLHFPCELWL